MSCKVTVLDCHTIQQQPNLNKLFITAIWIWTLNKTTLSIEHCVEDCSIHILCRLVYALTAHLQLNHQIVPCCNNSFFNTPRFKNWKFPPTKNTDDKIMVSDLLRLLLAISVGPCSFRWPGWGRPVSASEAGSPPAPWRWSWELQAWAMGHIVRKRQKE